MFDTFERLKALCFVDLGKCFINVCEIPPFFWIYNLERNQPKGKIHFHFNNFPGHSFRPSNNRKMNQLTLSNDWSLKRIPWQWFPVHSTQDHRDIALYHPGRIAERKGQIVVYMLRVAYDLSLRIFEDKSNFWIWW